MRLWIVPVLAVLALSGCGGSSPAAGPSTAAAPPTNRPDISLPAGPLRDLVPATADLPPGMVAILSGSGVRDLGAIADYSADPAAARSLLAQHGFRAAYTGQYADPLTGRVLSVVVTQFATAAGATADLAGDLTASAGTAIPGAAVGEQSDVRRQPLPAASAPPTAARELVTVRFRQGAYTWLVAYGAAPPADAEVALGVAKVLAARAATPA